MYKKAIVFGVFDGLHEGHKYFLNQAAEKTEQLVVVVTLDEIVLAIKNRTPLYTHQERLEAIKAFNPAFIILSGDSEMGAWTTLKEHKPDVVILGYDQNSIKPELEKLNIPFIILEPYFPEKYKSSLISRQ